MKTTSTIVIVVFIIGQLVTGCAREVGPEHEATPEQITAFKEAVDLESSFDYRSSATIMTDNPRMQAVYLRIVAMDPSSAYGKAAAERIEQLSRQFEAIMGSRR